MVRSGYFFDVADRSWQQTRFPPYSPFYAAPNLVHTFQGKAGIFGAPICDTDALCDYSEVIQYDSDLGRWLQVDVMRVPRAAHDVIDVPVEFCYKAEFTTTVSTITGGTDQTDSTVSDVTNTGETDGTDVTNTGETEGTDSTVSDVSTDSTVSGGTDNPINDPGDGSASVLASLTLVVAAAFAQSLLQY